MYPQETQLCLTVKQDGNKPILDQVFFTPPLKILDPTYETLSRQDITPKFKDSIQTQNMNQKLFLNIMLLSVSAGMMNKDRQHLLFNIGKKCHLRVVSQSFEKIHKMPLQDKDSFASRITKIYVDSCARFDYSPLPCIPFKDSRFFGETEIFLHMESKLYYSEILVAGRVGMGEQFAFDIFNTKLRVFINNELQITDIMALEPKMCCMSSFSQFHHFTHYLNMFIVDSSITQEMLYSKIQSYLGKDCICIGISRIGYSYGYCIKALCNRSDMLLELRDKLLL